MNLKTFLLFTQLLIVTNVVFSGDLLLVDNVRFVQRKTDKIVMVFYDLHGESGKKYRVALSLYNFNTGDTLRLDSPAIFGAAGKDIRPGEKNKIGWYLLKDFPNGLNGGGFIFIVDAYEQNSSRKWPWFLAVLTAAGGSAAYYYRDYLSGLRPKENQPPETELGMPPVFP